MTYNKKKVNMEEYYNSLTSMPSPLFSKLVKLKTKCRICLQEGDRTVNSLKNLGGMSEALKVVGNIETEDGEKRPTYLCYVCYKFLKSAVLFMQVATRTNETLRQPLQPKQSPDNVDGDIDWDDYDHYDISEDEPVLLSPKDWKNKKKLKERANSIRVQCPICKKLLGKNNYFKVHIQLHNPDFPDQFMCDICGKSFKVRKVYLAHKERHETRYIFKCQFCPYAARYKSNLSIHMRVHTGDAKYACPHCPAKYLRKGRLNDHIKLKHTEPEYKCEYCARAFHTSLNCQRHIDAAHLGLKNHVCNMCGKAFGYRKELLHHQRSIHKTKLRPYGRFNKNPSNKKPSNSSSD